VTAVGFHNPPITYTELQLPVVRINYPAIGADAEFGRATVGITHTSTAHPVHNLSRVGINNPVAVPPLFAHAREMNRSRHNAARIALTVGFWRSPPWLCGPIALTADQLVGADVAKVGDARKNAPLREAAEALSIQLRPMARCR
jgi:hypothetical protein